MSLKMSPKVSIKKLLKENGFENRQELCKQPETQTNKKIVQSISLAILFAVPFAVSFFKQNLQTEKYNCQR